MISNHKRFSRNDEKTLKISYSTTSDDSARRTRRVFEDCHDRRNMSEIKDLRELLNSKRKISNEQKPIVEVKVEEKTQENEDKPVRVRKPVRMRNPTGCLADLVRRQVVSAVEKNQKQDSSSNSSIKSNSRESLIEISSSSVKTHLSSSLESINEKKIVNKSEENANWIDMIDTDDEDEGKTEVLKHNFDKIHENQKSQHKNSISNRRNQKLEDRRRDLRRNTHSLNRNINESARNENFKQKKDKAEVKSTKSAEKNEVTNKSNQPQTKIDIKTNEKLDIKSFDHKNANSIQKDEVVQQIIQLKSINDTQIDKSFKNEPQNIQNICKINQPEIIQSDFHTVIEKSNFNQPWIANESQIPYNPHFKEFYPQNYHYNTTMQPYENINFQPNFPYVHPTNINYQVLVPIPQISPALSTQSDSILPSTMSSSSKLAARLNKIRSSDDEKKEENIKNSQIIETKSSEEKIEENCEISHHSLNLSPFIETTDEKVKNEDNLTHDQMINLLYVTTTSPKYFSEAMSYYMEYYNEIGVELNSQEIDKILTAKGMKYEPLNENNFSVFV